MVAVVERGSVIIMGNYTQEDYPSATLIEITQEQYDIISSFQVPMYDENNFFDGIMLINIDSERYANIIRMEVGGIIYSEFIANIRIPMLMGLITSQQYIDRKFAFADVKYELMSGDFEKARNLFILMGSSVIGQDLYDMFLTKLDSAIIENYNDYGIIQTVQKVSTNKNNT